ncbi:MSMEG_0570 family nitrogen starvation response protein [Rhodococcus sp. 2H158]
MPEMTYTVRWPDGRAGEYYSPSLVMHDHLTAGADYAVRDFVDRTRLALTEASERVRVKFGMYCTSAAATLAEIEATAGRYEPDAVVRVLALDPPTVDAAPSAAGAVHRPEGTVR